ncbi:MAG: hypothetical protein ACUZ8H_15555 [Candidatus Anammoxibacter sp.]
MSKHRRAARIDENQPEIVKALRKIPGVTVELGHDDILVGYQGVTYWFEIKDPGAVSKRTGEILDSEKKDSQKKLESEWKGQYSIVWNIDQILAEIGVEV